MSANRPVVSKDIFRFLRDLARHNNKAWMDANRERYRADLVEPFRSLLDCFAPAARKLNPRFSVSGRVGVNFSRINRDIRFAKDKTPYRSQMYLFFGEGDGDAGQLYYWRGGGFHHMRFPNLRAQAHRPARSIWTPARS